MTTATRTRYLDRDPDPADTVRLFCFHHAGGGASVFGGWAESLGPTAGVYPVQLPGREARIREPRLRALTDLIPELDAELDFALDRPFALYGHSMGALIAHQLAQHRLTHGRTLPSVLLAGAFPSPLLGAPLAEAARLGDDELSDLLVDIGGMSETIRRYPSWTAAAVSLLRDDLTLCHSARPAAPRQLPIPIRAFTGSGDPLVSRADAAAWAEHTTNEFTLDIVPGGHLFLRESRGPLLSKLSAALSAL
jgi:surfactin synthase thioesterase subunit